MSIQALKFKILSRVNLALGYFGWKLQRDLPDYVLFEYEDYDEYRATQVKWNVIKLERVWADSQVLGVVTERVINSLGKDGLFGLCHGSRNGFEQGFLGERLGGTILGTDISETASQFPNSVVHDFHEVRADWLGKADFIYSNSLDQSWNPKEALKVWVEQLRIGGLLFIEMSEGHSPRHASKMDPFGVNPEYFAYLLTQWLGHRVSVEVLPAAKSNPPMQIWLYEIKRIS
jgi:hypothetical protein